MINFFFFFLLEINADIYLSPTLHSALWKTGSSRWKKNAVVTVVMPKAGWHLPVHDAFRCANSNHPWLCCKHGPPVLWVANPFPRALCSPYIPRSFQNGDIRLSQQRRDWSPSQPSFLLCPLTEELAAVVGEASGRSLQAVPSAHPCSAQRKQGNRWGRLVPAAINGYPQIQGKPQWMLQHPFSGAKVLLFRSVLF